MGEVYYIPSFKVIDSKRFTKYINTFFKNLEKRLSDKSKILVKKVSPGFAVKNNIVIISPEVVTQKMHSTSIISILSLLLHKNIIQPYVLFMYDGLTYKLAPPRKQGLISFYKKLVSDRKDLSLKLLCEKIHNESTVMPSLGDATMFIIGFTEPRLVLESNGTRVFKIKFIGANDIRDCKSMKQLLSSRSKGKIDYVPTSSVLKNIGFIYIVNDAENRDIFINYSYGFENNNLLTFFTLDRILNGGITFNTSRLIDIAELNLQTLNKLDKYSRLYFSTYEKPKISVNIDNVKNPEVKLKDDRYEIIKELHFTITKRGFLTGNEFKYIKFEKGDKIPLIDFVIFKTVDELGSKEVNETIIDELSRLENVDDRLTNIYTTINTPVEGLFVKIKKSGLILPVSVKYRQNVIFNEMFLLLYILFTGKEPPFFSIRIEEGNKFKLKHNNGKKYVHQYNKIFLQFRDDYKYIILPHVRIMSGKEKTYLIETLKQD